MSHLLLKVSRVQHIEFLVHAFVEFEIVSLWFCSIDNTSMDAEYSTIQVSVMSTSNAVSAKVQQNHQPQVRQIKSSIVNSIVLKILEQNSLKFIKASKVLLVDCLFWSILWLHSLKLDVVMTKGRTSTIMWTFIIMFPESLFTPKMLEPELGGCSSSSTNHNHWNWQ